MEEGCDGFVGQPYYVTNTNRTLVGGVKRLSFSLVTLDFKQY